MYGPSLRSDLERAFGASLAAALQNQPPDPPLSGPRAKPPQLASDKVEALATRALGFDQPGGVQMQGGLTFIGPEDRGGPRAVPSGFGFLRHDTAIANSPAASAGSSRQL
jgi:hypothetical protein